MCAFSTANESFPTLKQFLWFPFHRIDLKFRKITREKRQQLPWVQWEEKKQENRIKTNAWDTNTCTTAFCTNFWLSSMQPPYTHTYTHTRNYCCSLAAHRRRVLHTVQCMYVPYVFLYVYLYSFIRSTLFRFHFVTLLYKFSGFFFLSIARLCALPPHFSFIGVLRAKLEKWQKEIGSECLKTHIRVHSFLFPSSPSRVFFAIQRPTVSLLFVCLYLWIILYTHIFLFSIVVFIRFLYMEAVYQHICAFFECNIRISVPRFYKINIFYHLWFEMSINLNFILSPRFIHSKFQWSFQWSIRMKFKS